MPTKYFRILKPPLTAPICLYRNFGPGLAEQLPPGPARGEHTARALRWSPSAQTYMLSQNLVRVVGLSWFLRCRNQRWIFRTSQSSCLDKPSNLFPSGDWRKMKQMSFLPLLNLLSVLHYDRNNAQITKSTPGRDHRESGSKNPLPQMVIQV